MVIYYGGCVLVSTSPSRLVPPTAAPEGPESWEQPGQRRGEASGRMYAARTLLSLPWEPRGELPGRRPHMPHRATRLTVGEVSVSECGFDDHIRRTSLCRTSACWFANILQEPGALPL